MFDLISIFSRGTLRTTWSRKTDGSLNAITTSRTHGAFLSLNTTLTAVVRQCHTVSGREISSLISAAHAEPETLLWSTVGQNHSQELLFLQQDRVVLGVHYVLSDQSDLRGRQRLSLRESPVREEHVCITHCCLYVAGNKKSIFCRKKNIVKHWGDEIKRKEFSLLWSVTYLMLSEENYTLLNLSICLSIVIF